MPCFGFMFFHDIVRDSCCDPAVLMIVLWHNGSDLFVFWNCQSVIATCIVYQYWISHPIRLSATGEKKSLWFFFIMSKTWQFVIKENFYKKPNTWCKMKILSCLKKEKIFLNFSMLVFFFCLKSDFDERLVLC